MKKDQLIREVVHLLFKRDHGYLPPNETCFSMKDFDDAKEIVEVIDPSQKI